jgi:hypothetical protein
MKLIEKLAKAWAHSNSSPGKDGDDELYAILIEVQEQAYRAGFRKAKDLILERELPREWFPGVHGVFHIPMQELIDLGKEEYDEQS